MNRVCIAAFLLASCQPATRPLTEAEYPAGIEVAPIEFRVEEVLTGLDTPWAIEVLAEHEYLVTDRMGALYHITDGASTPLEGLPQSQTFFAGRHYGGLMDVSLHPQFQENRMVYVAFVNPDYEMAVARFRLEENGIQDVEVVFESNAFSIGSRIAWADDEHFFVTQGVGGDPTPDPGPQDLENHAGKIHRLMADGSIPADNPVFDGHDGPTSIWSYGHRDPQGLYFDKNEGLLYANEHGPLGGDELNIIEKGGNYGWPRFSYGLNYDGTTVGDWSEQVAADSSVLPIKAWTPEFRLAPSGLERLDSQAFPEFGGWFVQGSLFQHRLIAHDLETGRSAAITEQLGRIRDVAQLPSGDLIVLQDSEGLPKGAGRIVRLSR